MVVSLTVAAAAVGAERVSTAAAALVPTGVVEAAVTAAGLPTEALVTV